MLARKALAGTAAAPKIYVEDVFSTYLYTGNGTGKSIQNDIKLGASYSGTTLKLNFDSNNTDSANSFTATATGTAGYSTADAKFGAGSCAGFDAASWLDYNPNAGNFGSGDWTVEFWVKTSSGNGPGIVTQAFGAGAGNTSWGFFVGYGTSGNIAFYLSDGSSYFASITSGTTAVNNNTWNHVAACRSGSTVYLFLNGVSQGTASVGTTALGNGGAPVRIGGQGTSYSMPSGTYIDDVRIIKGTALYTSGFTPPSAATNTTSYPPTTTAGEGGMVWIKARSTTYNNCLYDTERGALQTLVSNATDASASESGSLTAFNSNGFTLGSFSQVNHSSNPTYVSWTFRQAKKFFDVVTFTTNGSEPPNTGDISHNLGSTPGCVIVKKTSGSQDWKVYHTGLSGGGFDAINRVLQLNDTSAASTSTNWINVSSTTISFPGSALDPSSDYVAYLFAHDAGGFGDAGSDSIIKCGSFTCDGSGNAEVDLGWEPQWLLRKRSDGAVDWVITDNMRGWSNGGDDAFLYPNLSNAEASANRGHCTATGFTVTNQTASSVHIYIAIRRGPMKTPTSGTSVFTPVSTSGDVSEITSGFPVDFALGKEVKNSTSYGNYAIDRLRGGARLLQTNTTDSDITSQTFKFDSNTKFLQSGGGLFYGPSIYWLMRRAPGFFDQVCYTGTGSGTNSQSHNLGVTPEMLIFKSRSSIDNWAVFLPVQDTYIRLNSISGKLNGSSLPSAATSTTFDVGSTTGYSSVANVNSSGNTYVAYLFASLSGVSKVGSYTGNGSSQTINCGFTNGARFVLIRRTDASEDWYVFDSARGIVSGNDPFLYLNSNSAEGTSQDIIDPDNSGFIVNAVAGQNTNGATYIYLAIA